jgi:hypothetical protein
MDVSGITRKGGSLGSIRMIMHGNTLKTCYRESEIEAGFQSKTYPHDRKKTLITTYKSMQATKLTLVVREGFCFYLW